jgi:acetylglutamate kinase
LQAAIAKADTLIEALGWIRRFRDKVTVIKLGGSLMEKPDSLLHVLVDIVFMETVGMRPVVVHGGGAAISRAMDAAGIKPQFIQGRRFTDERSLEIVEHVLAGEINESLSRQIEELGGRAMSLNFRTTCVLYGHKAQLNDDQGRLLDLGHVGEVTRVDHALIEKLSQAGLIPVIPSMCWDENGHKLNVNADTAAMAVAQALGAEKLMFLSDVPGVLRDKDDPTSLVHTLGAEEARRLIREGVVGGGMIPKVEACLETLQRGVKKIHIVDGRVRHSLLLEIYTTSGVGTEIVQSVPADASKQPA